MLDKRVNLIHGDCLEKLAELPDACVDLLLTDPPYGTTELAFDKIRIDWAVWWREIHRVCRPAAPMICFAAQPFATDLINSNRRGFRYELVWRKTSAVGFLSANRRPLRAHELILVFGREGHKAGSVYNPQFEEGKPYHHRARKSASAHYREANHDVAYDNPGRRHPTSVLTYARDVPSLHPTAKPELLLRWLIRSYSHPGARVLDPFMGAGSTGVAARLEGREFVGMEMDEGYFEVARERLNL